MRRLLAATLAVALLAAFTTLPRLTPSASAGDEVSVLETTVLAANGRLVSVHFSVRAESEPQARSAAEAALAELMPGAVILGSEGAIAQFAPWSWQWDTGELPVPVSYNPGGAVGSVGPDAVAGALTAWSTVTGSDFTFAYGGFTNLTASLSGSLPFTDGHNVIAWRDLGCGGGCVLGVTTKDNFAHETDIVLNSSPGAGLGDGLFGTLDARTVILHEAGHMAGLEHSCPQDHCTASEKNAVMYYRYAGMRRDLREDDIAGIRTLYPARPVLGETLPVAPPPPDLVVSLSPGWNLAVLPAETSATFTSMMPCVQAIWQDTPFGWRSWFRNAPGDLATLDPSSAYWVYATTSCTHAFPQ